MSGEKGSQIETGPLNFPERYFTAPKHVTILNKLPEGLSDFHAPIKKMIYKNKKIFKKLMINISG